MTLASHPGRAVVRAPPHGNDGEQMLMGDASEALKVTYEGKYIHLVDEKRFWLEIPRNQHKESYSMWNRTLHSKNDDYFAWVINNDGTISSENNEELVLGFGISKDEEHWKDAANYYKWSKFKEIEGFELEELQEEKEEKVTGPYFRMVKDH